MNPLFRFIIYFSTNFFHILSDLRFFHTCTHAHIYVLLWSPSHGRAKAGRPARTYTQQLCEDSGCSSEDLPEAMKDREGWRERVRNISADGTTRWWWWWWWWYIPVSSFLFSLLVFNWNKGAFSIKLMITDILTAWSFLNMHGTLKTNYKNTMREKKRKIVAAYNNLSKRCILCLEGKMAITPFPNQRIFEIKRSDLSQNVDMKISFYYAIYHFFRNQIAN